MYSVFELHIASSWALSLPLHEAEPELAYESMSLSHMIMSTFSLAFLMTLVFSLSLVSWWPALLS